MASGKFLQRSCTVFLTGVTGFLGAAFLSQLLDSSFDGDVVCLVRGEDQDSAEERARKSVSRFRPKFRIPRNVRILRGDVLSKDWHSAPELDGVTHVLHLAASTSFGNHRGIRKTNIEGALSVAASMRGRNIQRYVHTGTATICGAAPPHVVHEDDYPSNDAQHLVAYTRSKADAEKSLEERYPDLPLVIARPSIVVGDTRLGCKPSGSIFWVLRAVEALRFITWDPSNRIDVVPVDWAATALEQLLFKPTLKHKRYHISAGLDSSIRWHQLAAEYARLRGGPARGRYEVGQLPDLTLSRILQAAGGGHPRHLLHALELYYRFCGLDLVFDNSRILDEGIPAPPKFTDYMQVCLESSTSSIYEQMYPDIAPAAAVA